jgi:hypothetical protein
MADFIIFPGEAVYKILSNLKPETPAQWGIMTAQHMIEHLLLPLEFSRGKFEVPLVTPIDKVEKVKRIMLMGDSPLKRDFAAPFLGSGLQALKYANLEEAKEALVLEITTFLAFWELNNGATFTHPIFGILNKEEWYWFHRKHFTHHFSQFGLV